MNLTVPAFHVRTWDCPDCGEHTIYADALDPLDNEPAGNLVCDTCGWEAYPVTNEPPPEAAA